MKKFLLLLSVFVTISLSACEDTNTTYGSTYDEIKDDILYNTQKDVDFEACAAEAGITEPMKSNAELYRECSHKNGGGRNGVYLYTASVKKYADAPQKLAARVALLGFNDVYLSPGKEMITSVSQWLRTFIATSKEYGMSVQALRVADNNLYVNESAIDAEVELIKKYNNSVAPNERFDGIAADLEPHTCKGSNKPSGLNYEWNSSTNYGIGGANDKLLQLTVDIMHRTRSLLPKQLLLNEAIAYNFQIKNDEGVLSNGKISDFMGACDWVILMSYLDNKEAIWSKSEPSLKAAEAIDGKTKTVSICVKTAINDIDNSESLRSKGWQYLLDTAEYILQMGKSYKSFRGFDIFTYEGIEIMWEEASN